MSSAPGAGPTHPSARQTTDTHDTGRAPALGYSDPDTANPTAERPATGAYAESPGQNANELDYGNDANPQPLDPSLIAGGENLVGAANHVATGVDALDSNFSDEEDAPVRIDREGFEQEDESSNTP